RSGRCLDVRGGDMANSTPTQIFDCNGSRGQGWRWSPERRELFIRADTARCLDVRGGNPANSTPIQIFNCNNTPAQDWNLPLD
ncbi:MAG TPA: ricin-type beta-trefoil lectin domain protein, partial [Pilimelia sp.]|nr:ricin-type beta-trefoil lectin domain protein [Pilimelia sp.]